MAIFEIMVLDLEVKNTSYPVHFLISVFFRLELHDWYKLNSKLNSLLCYIPWDIIFAFIIWAIQLGRNSLIFTGKFIPYHILKQNAIAYATKFFFLSTIPLGHPSPSSLQYIRWSPAPFPYVTLNTDGSLLDNPRESGAGGMACTANGEWL